jgi:ferrous iron transport protein B
MLIHTWERSWEYLKRAGTILLAVSIVMWALMSYPQLPDEELSQMQTAIAAASNDDLKQQLQNQLATQELAYTWAGRAGQFMTHYTTWLELDWRFNVALLGGLAAKEVIVSTLGTSYSMNEEQLDEENTTTKMTLARRLAEDPDWTPLKAVAVMILVMIYSPCIASLSVMWRETKSLRWPLFSLGFNTMVAYLLASAVLQLGHLLGLG